MSPRHSYQAQKATTDRLMRQARTTVGLSGKALIFFCERSGHTCGTGAAKASIAIIQDVPPSPRRWRLDPMFSALSTSLCSFNQSAQRVADRLKGLAADRVARIAMATVKGMRS